MRRGLAYDQAGLIDYNLHNQWVDRLFRALHKKVPDGFVEVSIQQILDADKELWNKLADECRSGIIPRPGGLRPLEEALKVWTSHADVLYFLLPTPGRKESGYGPARDKSSSSHNRAQPKGKGKSGGKGKGRQGQGNTTMPDGCTNKTKEGRNVCFHFNSAAGCTFAKPGAACRRGAHVCAKMLPSGVPCQEKHSATACPH
jgi:hypothetical protein